MNQLNLVVPGLLGPFANELPVYIKQQLNEPEFNGMNKFLSRADVSDTGADNFYETLVQLINPKNDFSVCQLTSELDGIETSNAYFYRADPVHFKAESDHAILIGPELVQPEMYEVDQLITSFNEHFAEDNISLHATNERRWYLKSNRPLALSFSALDYALGRDIKHFMPQGEDELWWRKIVNEAQMLFFQHEVNELRENQGLLSINGLWLWDMTFDQGACITGLSDKLYSNDALAISLATSVSNTPATSEGKNRQIEICSVDKIEEINSDTVLVLDQLYETVCYGDVGAWLKDLKHFCDEDFKRIVKLLISRKIDVINIYPCNGQVFKINRFNLFKFWRQNKTLLNT